MARKTPNDKPPPPSRADCAGPSPSATDQGLGGGGGGSASPLGAATFANTLPSLGLGPALSGRPVRGCTGRRGPGEGRDLVTPAPSQSAKPQVSLQPDLEEKSTEFTSQENLKCTLFSKLFSISHGEKRLIHLVNEQRSYFSTFGRINIKEKNKNLAFSQKTVPAFFKSQVEIKQMMLQKKKKKK